MTTNYYFDNFYGTWTTKKSLYLLENRLEKKYEEVLKIQKNPDIQHVKYDSLIYIIIKNNIRILNECDQKIIKITKKCDLYYNVNLLNDHIIKVECVVNKKDKTYNYSEYIYSINQNLKISFSFLKKNKKYLLIVFTSYIKKLAN